MLNLSSKERQLLLEIICEKQFHMIAKNNLSYANDKYNRLEKLKVKINDYKTEGDNKNG